MNPHTAGSKTDDMTISEGIISKFLLINNNKIIWAAKIAKELVENMNASFQLVFENN